MKDLTELYYQTSEKLGLDFKKIYRRDKGINLKDGEYPCDYKTPYDKLITGVTLKIETKKSKGKVVQVISVSENGYDFQMLDHNDLQRAAFKIGRRYAKLKVVEGAGQYEGMKILVDSRTKKPIPTTGKVSNPCYIKHLAGFHPNKEQECSYRIEESQKDKSWVIHLGGRGSTILSPIPEGELRYYRFCFS